MFITLASTNVLFFIAVAYALWLLWQPRLSIDLQWEKGELPSVIFFFFFFLYNFELMISKDSLDLN